MADLHKGHLYNQAGRGDGSLVNSLMGDYTPGMGPGESPAHRRLQRLYMPQISPEEVQGLSDAQKELLLNQFKESLFGGAAVLGLGAGTGLAVAGAPIPLAAPVLGMGGFALGAAAGQRQNTGAAMGQYYDQEAEAYPGIYGSK